MHKVAVILLCVSYIFAPSDPYILKSPDQQLMFIFSINDSSEPEYQLYYKNKAVIESSKLAIDLKNQLDFRNDFIISEIDTTYISEEWESVWGEVKSIKNTPVLSGKVVYENRLKTSGNSQ